MVNPRYVKPLERLGQKEFFKLFKEINSTRPTDYQFAEDTLVHPSKVVEDIDMPFVAGDRVQITSGPDKGKVGYIVQRSQLSSNDFMVQGAGINKMINPVQAKDIDQENWQPVSEYPKTFSYKNLRLVSKIKGKDGKETDVVIHSLELGPQKYNSFTNKHERIRYAKYDHSIVIPYPAQERPKPVPEEKATLTTSPAVVDARTHFVMSAIDNSLPMNMVRQVTNLDSKYKRARYAKRLTAEQIAAAQPPKMPIPPRTRKLLAELAALPKPEHPQFSPEMAAFLDKEIKSGLQARAKKETENLKSYQ